MSEAGRRVPADTIDEVVERLTEIVEWSRAANSRLGYFAALYRKVTVKIREGIISRSIRAEMVGSSVSGRHCAFPPLP